MSSTGEEECCKRTQKVERRSEKTDDGRDADLEMAILREAEPANRQLFFCSSELDGLALISVWQSARVLSDRLIHLF